MDSGNNVVIVYVHGVLMGNFKAITPERGKEIILLNKYKYAIARRRRDGLMKWKCSDQNCSAGVLTKTDKFVHASNAEHNEQKL